MVIIGYSGTGKSVAIKHIVGLLEPDAGSVFVDGLEVPTLSRRELYELRAQHRLRLPVRRAVRLAHHRRKRRHGAAQAGRARPSARSPSASHEALELVDLPNVADRVSRPSCRAACASASASRARSRCGRSTSCTMSRPPASIPSPAPSSTSSWSACASSSASRASSSRTTCAARTRVGTRIAMLYEGTRAPGRDGRRDPADERSASCGSSSKGRPTLDLDDRGRRLTMARDRARARRDVGGRRRVSRRRRTSRCSSSSATATATGDFPRATSRTAKRPRPRRCARCSEETGLERSDAARRRSTRSTGTSGSAAA